MMPKIVGGSDKYVEKYLRIVFSKYPFPKQLILKFFFAITHFLDHINLLDLLAGLF